MTQPSLIELLETLQKCINVLEDVKVSYHLTGGLVSTFYGEPRFTQDIDVVLRVRPEQMAPLIILLDESFDIDHEAAFKALLSDDMFQVMDPKRFIKVDFHVGEAIPGELERSRREVIESVVPAMIASLEDAIASKLHWINLGSHKSREDVVGMLNGQHEVDMEKLSALCSQMGLQDLLSEMVELAENE